MAGLPAVLIWLAAAPAPAAAGYDIAHIVERTCEPGGPLIVTDLYKLPRDRDRFLTEPGEVIGCPPAGPDNAFQIAAGPEGIGGEPYLCTYLSLMNGEGGDTCSSSASGGQPTVNPVRAVQVGDSGRLTIVGIVTEDVASVALAGTRSVSSAPVMPIMGDWIARLGSARFSYFALAIDSRAVCAGEPVRVLGLDGSGRPIAENTISTSTSLLSDEASARKLASLCPTPAPDTPIAAGWLADISAILRSLFSALI